MNLFESTILKFSQVDKNNTLKKYYFFWIEQHENTNGRLFFLGLKKVQAL